ncbi:hypothetical protein [Kiloniella majae]|uniref:hypothetical protein n=1 Tax=Kiloniella majae TaxID=1938558 RepID=UPI000A2781CC|nr:hypothetical protein [Kiloniella majae]
MMRWVFVISMLSISSVTFAEEKKDDCPRKIASIGESVLADTGERILKSVYKALGCEIVVQALPGRRALAAFNNSSVDGELYRLRIAESKYKRSFVRSETPIFTINNSLWAHPNKDLAAQLPIGYVRGILWQEKYMDGRRGKIFNSVEDVFLAFDHGEVGAFLSTDFSVASYQAEKGFQITPVRFEKINTASLYHYLGAEFSPFMKRFSMFISAHSSFSELEIPMDGEFVN